MTRNVLGGALRPCEPDDDAAAGLVCVRLTADFLALDASAGEGSPRRRPGPPGAHRGVAPGRWEAARRAGVAPPVVLRATDARVLDSLTLEHLVAHGEDVPLDAVDDLEPEEHRIA